MSAHKCDGCRYKGEHQEMGFKPFGVCFKETNLIKAEENYKAETCPYKFALPQLYETEEIETEPAEEWPKENPYIKKDNDLEKACADMNAAIAVLAKLLTPAIEAFAECFGRCVKMISDALPLICDTVGDVMEQIIDLYPNARVKHLAIHGKNKRIRKKNINRILKYFERETKKAP